MASIDTSYEHLLQKNDVSRLRYQWLMKHFNDETCIKFKEWENKKFNLQIIDTKMTQFYVQKWFYYWISIKRRSFKRALIYSPIDDERIKDYYSKNMYIYRRMKSKCCATKEVINLIDKIIDTKLNARVALAVLPTPVIKYIY